MLPLPRVAIGAIRPGGSYRPVLWALVDALRRQGLHIQPFFASACFSEHRAIAAVAGATPRHLDAWLMTPDLCRDVFLRGAGASDLAVIEGEFGHEDPTAIGGGLETLCQWLELPRLAVLDASQLVDGLPPPPEQVDGVLMDRVESGTQLARTMIQIETQWEVPVLGSLEIPPLLRKELEQLIPGDRPSAELCHALGDNFLRTGEPERVVEIASRRPITWKPPGLFTREKPLAGVVVALAYDDSMNCYFPDTLDLLELCGATIVDFSPLRDGAPPEADIIYLGCGHPERYAAQLSGNECMRLAIRNHVRKGGRIYAEGGGAAYLCQHIETPTGMHRMVGILPAVARSLQQHAPPRAVEFTLTEPCRLGNVGDTIRGYLDARWRLEPVGALHGCASEAIPPYSLVKSCRTIGSWVQLDFAAQPHLLSQFFHNAENASDNADPWQIH